MEDAEEQRINNKVQQLVAEAVAKEKKTLHAAENQRKKTLEASWNETIQERKNDIQKQLLDMSIQIAEMIIQRELPDRDMLRSIIQETLAPVSDLQGIRIRMAPHDSPDNENGSEIIAPQWRAIEWVADPTLAPGDVIVESRNGIFDARIKERLQTLREAIANPARYTLPSNVAKTGKEP